MSKQEKPTTNIHSPKLITDQLVFIDVVHEYMRLSLVKYFVVEGKLLML